MRGLASNAAAGLGEGRARLSEGRPLRAPKPLPAVALAGSMQLLNSAHVQGLRGRRHASEDECRYDATNAQPLTLYHSSNYLNSINYSIR